MKRKRKGFTLLELIVVLAIIAILLVLIVPRISGYVGNARETAAQNNASAVLSAAELYVIDQQTAGNTVPASIGSTQLSDYLDHMPSGDSYTLTATYNDANDSYAISGNYTSGDIVVTIPEMTVSHTSDKN